MQWIQLKHAKLQCHVVCMCQGRSTTIQGQDTTMLVHHKVGKPLKQLITDNGQIAEDEDSILGPSFLKLYLMP
eukprot:591427-Amphidinium_carterae.2